MFGKLHFFKNVGVVPQFKKMVISDRINGIDRILKGSGHVLVNGAVQGADGIHDGCTKGARGYGREFPVPGTL